MEEYLMEDGAIEGMKCLKDTRELWALYKEYKKCRQHKYYGSI
jgi:hypothetical protein